MSPGSSPPPPAPFPAASSGAARTPGAALVKLRRGLVEQRVHGEGEVELLDVECLQAALQRRLGVELVGASPAARRVAATALAAVQAAVAQLSGCTA